MRVESSVDSLGMEVLAKLVVHLWWSPRRHGSLSGIVIWQAGQVCLGHPYTLVLVSSLTHTHSSSTIYRFLKDLELRNSRSPKLCCCYFVGQELLIFADDKDALGEAVRQCRSEREKGEGGRRMGEGD